MATMSKTRTSTWIKQPTAYSEESLMERSLETISINKLLFHYWSISKMSKNIASSHSTITYIINHRFGIPNSTSSEFLSHFRCRLWNMDEDWTGGWSDEETKEKSTFLMVHLIHSSSWYLVRGWRYFPFTDRKKEVIFLSFSKEYFCVPLPNNS